MDIIGVATLLMPAARGISSAAKVTRFRPNIKSLGMGAGKVGSFSPKMLTGPAGTAKNISRGTSLRTAIAEAWCFVEGTLILTEQGLKEIQDIQVGDLVLSSDPDTGETAYKEVVNVFVNEAYELIHVSADDEVIVTTPSHPFWVEDRGFVPAGMLMAGDMLRLSGGTAVAVRSIEREYLDEPVTVYNFEVADWHTYFVSEAGLLVHNTCKVAGNKVASGSGNLTNGIPNNPQVVRRFMSKKEYKEFIKNGFKYNPNDPRGGISATSKIEPVNPDAIKRSTGALGAEYYVDINTADMNIFLKGKTKGGLPDWKIQNDVKTSDITASGRVRK